MGGKQRNPIANFELLRIYAVAVQNLWPTFTCADLVIRVLVSDYTAILNRLLQMAPWHLLSLQM